MNNEEGKVYRYFTGEEVQLGDNTFYPAFGEGYVSYIFQPHSKEAIAWGLPDGAVMGGFEGFDVSISFSDTVEEEDLVFLSRKGARSSDFNNNV